MSEVTKVRSVEHGRAKPIDFICKRAALDGAHGRGVLALKKERLRPRGLLRQRLKLAIRDCHAAQPILSIAAPLCEACLLAPKLEGRERRIRVVAGLSDRLTRRHLRLQGGKATLTRLKAQNRLLAIAALRDA